MDGQMVLKKKPKTIPNEITSDILTRLPVKSLLRFRGVCKSWCSLIRHRFFLHSHLARSLDRPGGTTLLITFYDECSYQQQFFFADHGGGAAVHVLTFTASRPPYISENLNGLFCLYSEDPFTPYYKDSFVQVCNVSTREFVIIRDCTPRTHPNFNSHISYYFGFDSKTREYKVLSMCLIFSRENVRDVRLECGIFTFGTESWRRIVDPVLPFDFDGRVWMLYFRKCVCVNGAIHWMLPNENLILAFDFKDENFRVFPLPGGLVLQSFEPHNESDGDADDGGGSSGSENEYDSNSDDDGSSGPDNENENDSDDGGSSGANNEYGRGIDDVNSHSLELIQLAGFLVVVDYKEVLQYNAMRLWILGDYENQEWIKRTIVFPCDWRELRCPFPVGAIHTGEILMAPNEFSRDFLLVHYYHVNSSSFRSVQITGLPEWRSLDGKGSIYITEHVENVTSLKLLNLSMNSYEG